MLHKDEIVTRMAKKAGLTKKVSALALEAFSEVIEDSLIAQEGVKVTGLGIFDIQERAERNGFNPITSEKILIPASSYPRFKVAGSLRAKIKAANKSKREQTVE